jgi:hypothetical protein
MCKSICLSRHRSVEQVVGARGLGPHGTEVARKAKGLEAAIVDNSIHHLTALDAADARTFEVAIAGLAALLVAKLHKIAEREAARKIG